MPTLFSKWNGKALLKANSTAIGHGISSTDLAAGSEDAEQIKEVPDVSQLSTKKVTKEDAVVAAPAVKTTRAVKTTKGMSGSGPDISAWRAAASQQLIPPNLSEFGAGGGSLKPSQRASTGHQGRRGSEKNLLPASYTLGALSSKSFRQRAAIDSSSIATQPPNYGYTTIGWDHQMDVTRAVEIVLACGEQIRARGLDWPLIFSSMALDTSAHNINTLLKSLLQSPAIFLSSDIKFANPHDLAAIIKWTLARIGKVVPVPIPSTEQTRKGLPAGEESILIQQRGFLEWDNYTRWAAEEKGNAYQPSAFSSFLDSLSSSSLALLVATLSLLSSTTSYSHKNGMTPSRLSRLFGVLLFGLPEDETFERTYEAFTRAGNATEHLLLAYIRDCGTLDSLPTRLADHVQAYPTMLSTDLTRPSRSVRGVPMTHINRTVRLYSLDLIQSACEMDVAEKCTEWKACCSSSDTIGQDPQLSDRYRKLINMRSSKKQGRSLGSPKESIELESYGSLVDKKWGDFMYEGFSTPDDSRLNFDLRESERKARKQRPDSVQWSQFEKSGFVIADDGLASVLSFDDGLKDDLERWPAEREELMEKLRKTNKMIPAFPYDTVPYIVSSPSLDQSATGQWDQKPISCFDEVFAEVYADVLLGSGWSNRDEQTHRSASFVVVQYKSRPTPSTVGSQSAGTSHQTRGYVAEPDDRVDAAWFVVQEIVPSQYRSEMEASGRSRGRTRASLRKLNIFKRRKEETSRKTTTQSDPPPSTFDELFKPGLGGVTKRLQLSKDPSGSSSLSREDSGSTIRQTQGNGETEEVAGAAGGGSRLLSTFRSKSLRMRKWTKEEDDLPPVPPPKRGVFTSNSFGSDDFDTRSLQDSELEAIARESSKKSILKGTRSSKRQSKDDTWLDVMVRSNGFRGAGHVNSSQNRSTDQQTSITPTPSRPDLTLVTSKTDHNDGSSFSAPSDHGLTASGLPAAQGSDADHTIEETSTSPLSTSKRKAVPIRDASGDWQANGWTKDDVIERAPQTPPKKDVPSFSAGQVSSDVHSTSPKSQSKKKSSNESTATNESPSGLAYLQPLPSKSDLTEREKARELRIQAAKDRAKQLRASLNPLAIKELDKGQTLKPAPTLLAPLRSPVEASKSPSSVASSSNNGQPKSLITKIDPFSKDRFSGRVASVASRFGGGAAKSLTPQSTGNSARAVSPNQLAPVMDPNEPPSRHSLESSTVDNDSIYPEDAVSNFSRDTNPDEDGALRAAIRPGGSIAALATNHSSDVERREEEDVAKAMPSTLRIPYQPGMPLSNLEEESESILSGSNH